MRIPRSSFNSNDYNDKQISITAAIAWRKMWKIKAEMAGTNINYNVKSIVDTSGIIIQTNHHYTTIVNVIKITSVTSSRVDPGLSWTQHRHKYFALWQNFILADIYLRNFAAAGARQINIAQKNICSRVFFTFANTAIWQN